MLIPTYVRDDSELLGQILKIWSKGYGTVELKYVFGDMNFHMMSIFLATKRYYGELRIMRRHEIY